MPESEPFVIEAQQVQDRRMDIVDVRLLLGGPQAHSVSCPDDLPALDAAAGEPHGKAVRIMVASILTFTHRHPSEFAAPDHER